MVRDRRISITSRRRWRSSVSAEADVGMRPSKPFDKFSNGIKGRLIYFFGNLVGRVEEEGYNLFPMANCKECPFYKDTLKRAENSAWSMLNNVMYKEAVVEEECGRPNCHTVARVWIYRNRGEWVIIATSVNCNGCLFSSKLLME
jgi:hypothetical protein